MIADLGFQLLDLISTASLRPSYIVSKMAGFETIKIQRIGHWICVFCMISFWLYRASQVFRVWRWPLKYLGLPLEGHPRWSWPILFFSMFRFWFTNCKLIWNEGAHFCHLAFGECCFYSTRQKKKITLFYWVFLANISWGSYVTHSSFFLFFPTVSMIGRLRDNLRYSFFLGNSICLKFYFWETKDIWKKEGKWNCWVSAIFPLWFSWRIFENYIGEVMKFLWHRVEVWTLLWAQFLQSLGITTFFLFSGLEFVLN